MFENAGNASVLVVGSANFNDRSMVVQTYVVTTPLTYFTAVPGTFPDGSNFTWF